MLRLLQLGVVPFGTMLQSSLLAQYPQYAANDLAGLNPDMPSLRKVVTAFRPYIDAQLRTKHNIQMLALYVYPAQVLYCKAAFGKFEDLRGRRVRVSSLSQSDFVKALGAQPVITGFAQIMVNMNSGNIDCAITGTMSGNTMGLHEVTTHIHTLPITWGLAIFGANKDAWDNLPPDLKALLSHELPKLETAIWTESERETADGLACNIGSPDCRSGRKGQMTKVVLSDSDAQLARNIFSTVVLPRWLARCGVTCSELWNLTIGPATGLVAK
jgi:TRAP-type C4-dicarboxylate transport system substrate-binding protein